MAYDMQVLDFTLPAAADLSADQYEFITVDSNGNAALVGVGAAVVGVLQNKPTAGQAAEIRIYGVSKVVAGAAIAAGALVSSDANGEAKTAVLSTVNTSDAGTLLDPVIGSGVVGMALAAAGGAGEIIPVALLHMGAVATTAA